ncbi:translation machinery-associated 22 [Micractinium conductrix]|uniref:Translation machinery-associated 22 n=1 Tax=Micractinium conductrix TaxID=554055 RepID=A0A2P6VE02_9CHLO|nr:translation machinery-associated 22 [Micractinium conductrix]|eukprot:PSC72312.1 translation machinery-associated 22 [Micractinium conductrix]
MAAEGEVPAAEPPAPQVVEYDPVTGVPAEFNENLPKDSEEYKRWKASREAEVSGAMEGLSVAGGGGAAGGEGGAAAAAAAPAAAEKQKSSKKSKKGQPEVVLERNTRNKKKCITTISGLDAFGVKLNEASKLFGKKFASGASVVKNAEGKEHIDVQGDFLDQAVELILKQFKEVKKGDIYHIESKKKQRYFDEDDA